MIDNRHRCEGYRCDQAGQPYRCPLKITDPDRRLCGRCQIAHESGWFELSAAPSFVSAEWVDELNSFAAGDGASFDLDWESE